MASESPELPSATTGQVTSRPTSRGAQITYFWSSQHALRSTQLQFCTLQTLVNSLKVLQMFFPGLGEHNDVVQVKQTRLPVKTGEDEIHEASKSRGVVTEPERHLVEFIQLSAARLESRFIFIRFPDRHLPVTVLRSSVENQQVLWRASWRSSMWGKLSYS